MPFATIGAAVMADSDEVETPIFAVQATPKVTGTSVLPTTFSGVPPGCGQFATCTAAGMPTALPTKAWSCERLSPPRGISEMRWPGTFAFSELPKRSPIESSVLQPARPNAIASTVERASVIRRELTANFMDWT